jgi:hypothetical protein
VIAVSMSGTMPARGLLAKWPVSHSTLPFLSVTLSIPDCKNRIARKRATRRRRTRSAVALSGADMAPS